jgi:hypothetical protein
MSRRRDRKAQHPDRPDRPEARRYFCTGGLSSSLTADLNSFWA